MYDKMALVRIYVIGLLACVAWCDVTVPPRSSGRMPPCTASGLVRYNVTLSTHWSQDTFPKHFPLVRPGAQWSRTVGRTHSGLYRLWTLGEVARPFVREFAQDGQSKLIDLEPQGHDGILDTFSARNIARGVGSTSVTVMADASHSKVSLITRLIPSPDWFVGVDSLDLCQTDQWRREVSVQLHPMDAGTDMGFTFSAPNWPEVPPKAISRITSSFPDHPASSFKYEDRDQLPAIADIVFTLVARESDVVDSSGNTNTLARSESNPETPNNILQDENGFPESEAEMPPTTAESKGKIQGVRRQNLLELSNKAPGTNGVGEKTENRRGKSVKNVNKKKLTRKQKNKRRKQLLKEKKRNRRRQKEVMELMSRPQDCQVSEWSEWSPCSKTCGYGTRMRSRSMSVRPLNSGAQCPDLVESDEMCGSMRNCGWTGFSFDKWGATNGQ